MINYTEKGAGLHLKINKLGLYFRQEDGVYMSNDDDAVQALIDGYTLAEAQAYKSQEISDCAKALRDKAIKSVSAGEMASWPIKLSEAAKYAATGVDADAPMLSAEAAMRGITLAELVAKVGNNATGFAALEAQIGGVDGMHRDAVKALTTFEGVNGYDYSAGWPVV